MNRGSESDASPDGRPLNATALLRLMAQGESDIRGGRLKPQEEVFEAIESVLLKNLLPKNL